MTLDNYDYNIKFYVWDKLKDMQLYDEFKRELDKITSIEAFTQ
jgi:hypothetical protein